MYTRYLMIPALAAFAWTIKSVAEDKQNPRYRLASFQVDIMSLMHRSQGPNTTESFKTESQRLSLVQKALLHASFKDESETLTKAVDQLGRKIEEQKKRRDICQPGFYALASQACITLDLSRARQTPLAAAAGDRILFTGSDATVDIFDTAKNVWTTDALPAAKNPSGALGLASDRAAVYALHANNKNLLIDIYSSTTGQWTSVSSNQTYPASIKAAAIGSRLLFWTAEQPGNLDVFDADKKEWSKINTETSTPLRTGVVAQDKIYFMRSNSASSSNAVAMELYDATQSTWSSVPVPTDMQSTFIAGAFANGSLYWVARERSSAFDPTFNNYFCRQRLVTYNVASGIWMKTFIPGCSDSWTSVSTDEEIIFAAGNDRESSAIPVRDYAFVYNSVRNLWSKATLTLRGEWKPLAAAKGKVVVGPGSIGFDMTEVNVYEPRLQQWSGKTSLKQQNLDGPGTIGRINFIDPILGRMGGWAADEGSPATALKIRFYRDGAAGQGTLLGETSANVEGFDNDVEGPHGFVFTIPPNSVDNKQHMLYAYAVGSDGMERALVNSPFAYTVFKPSNSTAARQMYYKAMEGCNAAVCHAFSSATYDDTWKGFLKNYQPETFASYNNYLFNKMSSGQHAGPIPRLDLLQAWFNMEFPDVDKPRN